MTRDNYNIDRSTKFAKSVEFTLAKKRVGRASAVPAGTTFIVSNFPAFAGALVVNVGANGTAATNSDSISGAFVFANTGTTAADSVKVVTATAATRRQWNPRTRFKFVAPQAITNVRTHFGLFSADPSAVAGAGLGAGGLSAAVFNYDTAVDTGAAVGFWQVECGNAVGSTRLQLPNAITAGNLYTAEIVIDDAGGEVDFWFADHGAATAPVKDTPLKLVATLQATLPVAATPLLIGGTATNLGTATRRCTIGEVTLIQD